MSKEIHTQKHMTLSDRIFIEQSLAGYSSFKDIASVLKEGSHYGLKNNCAFLSSCQSARICEGRLCNGLCIFLSAGNLCLLQHLGQRLVIPRHAICRHFAVCYCKIQYREFLNRIFTERLFRNNIFVKTRIRYFLQRKPLLWNLNKLRLIYNEFTIIKHLRIFIY